VLGHRPGHRRVEIGFGICAVAQGNTGGNPHDDTDAQSRWGIYSIVLTGESGTKA